MIQFNFGRIGLALSVAASVGIAQSTSAIAASFSRYQAIDLGSLDPTSTTITVNALNDLGQAVGRYNVVNAAGVSSNASYIWDNGTLTALPLTGLKIGGPNDGQSVTMPGRGGLARSINNNGIIVGAGDELPGATDRAMKWTPNGSGGYSLRVEEFGGVESYFIDTNNVDQIAGYHIFAPGRQNAIAREGGSNTNTILPGIGGDRNQALALNDKGQIVGSVDGDGVQNNTTVNSAALWQKDANGNYVLTNLGTNGATQSVARDINKSGQIVGQLTTGSGATATSSAFLWQNNVFTLLDSLGGTVGDAVSINNDGKVVGYSRNSSNQDRASIWSNGMIADLNSLLTDSLLVGGSNVSLTRATGINKWGDVVAYGTYSYVDAQGVSRTGTRSYLLKSVPESDTALSLLVFGAIGGASFLRRNRRKATVVVESSKA